MRDTSLGRVLFAGLMASLGMVATLMLMPLLKLPKLNVFDLMSTLGADYTWWAEPLEYFVLGTLVLPVLFGFLVHRDLPGQSMVQKGVAWGVVLWLIREVVVSPIMGQGFFSMQAPHPVATIVQTFVGHVVYGAILGALAFPRAKGVPAQRRVQQPTRIR